MIILFTFNFYLFDDRVDLTSWGRMFSLRLSSTVISFLMFNQSRDISFCMLVLKADHSIHDIVNVQLYC
jgi:hypothetical protein